MKLAYIVGARPNVVKMAPVVAALRTRRPDWQHVLIHTGQHFDREMSDIFFEELAVPEPDHMLGVGSGTHAEQTARVMTRLEPLLAQEAPDVVLIPGDVNSTLAAALVAAKLGLRLAHVESGLRSFDRTMPEEINRLVADDLSDLLFLHSEEAVGNLRREGVADERMHFVGNTMIDTLVAVEERFRAMPVAEGLGLDPGTFLLVTLHRPALVDGPLLAPAMRALEQVSESMPVVFPVHPRTQKMLAGIAPTSRVRLLEPLGYLEFLSLQANARGVLTDSGGVQEETTFLGVPCFTLRQNTERPVTVRLGTNTLLGLEPERISDIPALLASDPAHEPRIPELWDGKASERIADALEGLE